MFQERFANFAPFDRVGIELAEKSKNSDTLTSVLQKTIF
jgi:hypothetical protein